MLSYFNAHITKSCVRVCVCTVVSTADYNMCIHPRMIECAVDYRVESSSCRMSRKVEGSFDVDKLVGMFRYHLPSECL